MIINSVFNIINYYQKTLQNNLVLMETNTLKNKYLI